MAHSNRYSKRPDPTASPYDRDANGKICLRAPFTPSAYAKAKEAKRKEARRRNRAGLR